MIVGLRVPPNSLGGYMAMIGLYFASLVFLYSNVARLYAEGTLSRLWAIVLMVTIASAGALWSYFSWLYVAAEVSMGTFTSSVGSVIAIALVAIFGGFAYWVTGRYSKIGDLR